MALGLGYLVAMTTSMGLQQLKSWQDNKQSKELANKQLEMKAALQNKEFERLRRLQKEAHEIALEMEKEAHLQRREDIEKEYDNVFESLANQAELDKWPLNVVPFIMKGESFGSHIRGFDVATVHCILTPSNNSNFNRWIFSKLDMKVEELMNNYWNSNTTHPIVYYGGSWKLKFPNGTPKFDYNDVTRLHSALYNIPVIAITPYFSPHGKFSVKVWCWGMGAEDDYNLQDIIPPTDLLTYEISKQTEYQSKDVDSEEAKRILIETTISELSVYFVSMVGYLNDMYYWKMYNLPPVFPRLLSKSKDVLGSIAIYIKQNYLDTLNQSVPSIDCTDDSFDKSLSFYKNTKNIMSKSEQEMYINAVISNYKQAKAIQLSTNETAVSHKDIPFIQGIFDEGANDESLKCIMEKLRHNVPTSIVDAEEVHFKQIIITALEILDDTPDANEVKVVIDNSSIFVAAINAKKEYIYDTDKPKAIVVIFNKLILSDRILLKSNSFILSKDKLEHLIKVI